MTSKLYLMVLVINGCVQLKENKQISDKSSEQADMTIRPQVEAAVGSVPQQPEVTASHLLIKDGKTETSWYGKEAVLKITANVDALATSVEFTICYENTCKPDKAHPGRFILDTMEYPLAPAGNIKMTLRPCRDHICGKWFDNKPILYKQKAYQNIKLRQLLINRFQEQERFWEYCQSLMARLKTHQDETKPFSSYTIIDQLRDNLINRGLDQCVVFGQAGGFGLVEKILKANINPKWLKSIADEKVDLMGASLLITGGGEISALVENERNTTQHESSEESKPFKPLTLRRPELKQPALSQADTTKILQDVAQYRAKWQARHGIALRALGSKDIRAIILVGTLILLQDNLDTLLLDESTQLSQEAKSRKAIDELLLKDLGLLRERMHTSENIITVINANIAKEENIH